MTRRDRDDGPGQPPHSQGVYGIAVTSDLVGRGVQNLRAYEKAGLLDPARTAGGTRLYSSDDVARLRRIQVLLARGLNLAGIAMVPGTGGKEPTPSRSAGPQGETTDT
jgi:MerR family transcriptional regulator, heat shock protein HspR